MNARSNKSEVAILAAVEPSGVAAIFRSLRSRDFTLFWGGNFLSNIGTWMQNIAVGWLLLIISNSPFLLGLNGFLSQIPALVLSLPGGVIADRFSRRKLMLGTQTVMMLLALILAVLASFHRVKVFEILAISLLTGTAAALNYPAYQALVPELVERSDLMNAIALNSAQFNMSRAIGPTLAGLALGSFGAAACFYLNSVSFLALIIALLVITIRPLNLRKDDSMWKAVMDGFRFMNKYRLLIVLLTIPAFLSFFGLPFIVLMPVFARDLIQVGASGLGYLMAGAGLGAVAAALTLASKGTLEHREKHILSSALLFSLSLIFLSQAHTFLWAFLWLIALGATMVGTLTLTNTTLQMISPPELRGRLMSMYNVAMTGLMPFGSLQAGAVAQTLGTRFALALGGGVCLLYFVLLLISLRRLRAAGRLPGPTNA